MRYEALCWYRLPQRAAVLHHCAHSCIRGTPTHTPACKSIYLSECGCLFLDSLTVPVIELHYLLLIVLLCPQESTGEEREGEGGRGGEREGEGGGREGEGGGRKGGGREYLLITPYRGDVMLAL